ncbi:hypothetical protein RM780_07885 [Streptomyces sp. DSM 44917]|uniref:DUF1273 domain-containing protein n=1 Tax=Streptomyces boetiae TaxID=3075541 RepID=A0ABU2L5V6_9ACTN|nr:hypothetical protein [Streptomyces sp. DSM 44917]MDT0306882.1 hypothetical protein [Streptomyces sp. DSM 44917]
MTTFAVTGHMDLTDDTVPLVADALRELLSAYAPDDLVGVSCIAEGADALFAQAVLAVGGRLVLVIPSRDYRARKVSPEFAATFDGLVEAAHEVVTMPVDRAGREAYEAAGKELLQRADRLVAVWDGRPGGQGGTAHTVEAARAAQLPVDVIWPAGAARRSAS